MATFLAKLAKLFQRVSGVSLATDQLLSQIEGGTPSAKAKKLVVARPIHMPQDYQLSSDNQHIDTVFQRLRENIYRTLDQQETAGAASQPRVFREHGITAANTAYFYLKPLNEKGWLFERSGTGWVVSRAEKIVGEDLFLRGTTVWDIANLYAVNQEAASPRLGGIPTDRQDHPPTARDGRDLAPTLPRVMSRVLGKELLSIPVYQHKLLRELNLAPFDTNSLPAQ